MEKKRRVDNIRNKGREIIISLRRAKTNVDYKKLQTEIDNFIETVDELFGTIDEDYIEISGGGNNEKSSDLSLSLSIACNWKKDEVNGQSEATNLATEYINQFEEYLESDDWIK